MAKLKGGDECGGKVKKARKPRSKKPKPDMEGMQVVEVQKSSPGIKELIKPKIPKARAPSKRNEIVKKVMMDKKMSMIEASKYVKENDLYKK